MFDKLQDRFSKTIQNLRGLGKIKESNISEAISEIRTSLLEADVQYRVVQSFVDSVRQRTLGMEVVQGVHPGQFFIKILHEELVRILGGETAQIPKTQGKPFTILLVGLQGSGKTTTAAKLGLYLRDRQSEKPVLVSADTFRAAAREQLIQLGKENGLSVFEDSSSSAVEIVKKAKKAVEGREVPGNLLIVDTQGRLAIDEGLMKELSDIRRAVSPDLVLYVLDSMAGQDAVRSAEVFASETDFDGVIVTKMDGDARGGAALSVTMATEKPIYFLGTGEKADALEPVYPDRLASRILGMGDIVSLVEKAQETVDEKEALELAKKLRKNQFTIADFQDQIVRMQKMGSMEQIMGMLPGGAQMKKAMAGAMPEKELNRIDAIINSMTPREKGNHQIIDGSRRKRIASGSGNKVQEVNRFLKQFIQTRKMMSRLGKVGMKGMKRGGMPPFMGL